MNEPFESLIRCLALDPEAQEAYLHPVPQTPVQVHAPEVETVTRKPRLIVALLLRSRPYSTAWWETWTIEQRIACEQMHALIAGMIELGVWALFSDDPVEKELAKEYYPIWGVCRILASKCISAMGWAPGFPQLPFEQVLRRLTTPVSEWSETMVR